MTEHTAENDATTPEWGIEFEGRFVPLDDDVPNTREAAESALGEALDYGADPETAFVAVRQVTAWVRVIPPGTGGTNG